MDKNKPMSNKTLCTLLFCSAFSMAGIGQIEFIHEDFDLARHQAEKESKIIFVDAYTTWCGPCKWMAKNTFYG